MKIGDNFLFGTIMSVQAKHVYVREQWICFSTLSRIVRLFNEEIMLLIKFSWQIYRVFSNIGLLMFAIRIRFAFVVCKLFFDMKKLTMPIRIFAYSPGRLIEKCLSLLGLGHKFIWQTKRNNERFFFIYILAWGIYGILEIHEINSHKFVQDTFISNKKKGKNYQSWYVKVWLHGPEIPSVGLISLVTLFNLIVPREPCHTCNIYCSSIWNSLRLLGLYGGYVNRFIAVYQRCGSHSIPTPRCKYIYIYVIYRI